MKIAITGITGFLGKQVAKTLCNSHEIIGIGRNETIGNRIATEMENISFIKLDLVEHEKLVDVFQGVDMVIHSAALSEPWGKYEDFYEANVVGTKHVVSACKQNNIERLIQISTPSIYFYFDSKLAVTEKEPIPAKFVNAYAKTKYQAEGIVKNSGIPFIILRPRALFGPEDTTIIPRLIQVNDTKKIPLPNKGNIMIDLTYIDNVVKAIELSVKAKPEAWNEIYNISNGDPRKLYDLLTVLFKKLDKDFNYKYIPFSVLFFAGFLLEKIHTLPWINTEPLINRYTASVLGKSQTLSIEKAQKLLNYEPVVSIDEGIDQFAKWYQASNLDKNF